MFDGTAVAGVNYTASPFSAQVLKHLQEAKTGKTGAPRLAASARFTTFLHSVLPGVEIVLDCVGASNFEQNLATLAMDGRYFLPN